MTMHGIDRIDHAITRATQAGLPLVPYPYHDVAAEVGIGDADVVSRMQRMLEEGVIRRIGAVPNHYALGLAAIAITDRGGCRCGPTICSRWCTARTVRRSTKKLQSLPHCWPGHAGAAMS